MESLASFQSSATSVCIGSEKRRSATNLNSDSGLLFLVNIGDELHASLHKRIHARASQRDITGGSFPLSPAYILERRGPCAASESCGSVTQFYLIVTLLSRRCRGERKKRQIGPSYQLSLLWLRFFLPYYFAWCSSNSCACSHRSTIV